MRQGINFKEIAKSVQSKLFISPLFLFVFMGISMIFDILFIIASSSILFSCIAFIFLLGTILLSYVGIKIIQTSEMTSKRYYIFKKSINYFALFQFLMSSIILVVMKINEVIDFTGYYILYAILASSIIIYFPVFLGLYSKKNQIKGGILAEVPQKNGKTKLKHVKVFKGIVFFIFEWVDAFVSAAILVIFINSLFLQIYRIPTESMVPSLYVEDRPVVIKTLTNPEIPLSFVQLPVTLGISRFQTAVMNNPRYTYTKEQILKDFFGNLLFMLSFSAIPNPKYDINGDIIVEPLVKRVIGMPGDTLLMADDQIYLKKGSTWEALTDDAKYSYTARNASLSKNAKRIQRDVPASEITKSLLQWDSEKNAITLESYSKEMNDLLTKLKMLPTKKNNSNMNTEAIPLLFTTNSIDEQFLNNHAEAFNKYKGDYLVLVKDFLFGFMDKMPTTLNPYEKSMWATNVLYKQKVINLVYTYLSSDSLTNASVIAQKTEDLKSFISDYLIFIDNRNFDQFPSDGKGIKPNNYFLLGDNRYNSLDCRVFDQTKYEDTPLWKDDAYSIKFLQRNNLFSVDASKIKGIMLTKFSFPGAGN